MYKHVLVLEGTCLKMCEIKMQRRGSWRAKEYLHWSENQTSEVSAGSSQESVSDFPVEINVLEEYH